MKIKSVTLAMVLFMAIRLQAGSISCSTATAVIPDGRTLGFDNVQPNTTIWYQVNAAASRSYSVEVRNDLDPDNTDLTVTFYGPGTCGSLTVFTTTDTHSIEPIAPASATRFSFVTGSSGNGVYRISVQNTSTTLSHYLTVTVAETTLYSATYNSTTGVTMYYSLLNTTSSSVSYTMTVYGTTGSQLGTSGLTALSALNVSLLNSTSGFLSQNSSGFVLLTHNGPPGAIQVEATLKDATDSAHPATRDVPFAAIRQLR